MDFNVVFAGLAEIQWPPPQLFQAVNEDDDEALLPLEGPLMHLPALHGHDFALPMRPGQNLPPQEQVVSRPYVNSPEDWREWPEYEGMGYVGVQEEYEDALNLQQIEEEQEEDLDDEITENKASQQGPVAVSLSTKRRDPVTNDNQLLHDINPSAPNIATIGLQELPMPVSTPPRFVPILEAHPQQ